MPTPLATNGPYTTPGSREDQGDDACILDKRKAPWLAGWHGRREQVGATPSSAAHQLGVRKSNLNSALGAHLRLHPRTHEPSADLPSLFGSVLGGPITGRGWDASATNAALERGPWPPMTAISWNVRKRKQTRRRERRSLGNDAWRLSWGSLENTSYSGTP